eukprot:1828866-Rhodomonas_salina.1
MSTENWEFGDHVQSLHPSPRTNTVRIAKVIHKTQKLARLHFFYLTEPYLPHISMAHRLPDEEETFSQQHLSDLTNCHMTMAELNDSMTAVNRATDMMDLDKPKHRDNDPMDAEQQCTSTVTLVNNSDPDYDSDRMHTDEDAPSTPQHSSTPSHLPDTIELINIRVPTPKDTT